MHELSRRLRRARPDAEGSLPASGERMLEDLARGRASRQDRGYRPNSAPRPGREPRPGPASRPDPAPRQHGPRPRGLRAQVLVLGATAAAMAVAILAMIGEPGARSGDPEASAPESTQAQDARDARDALEGLREDASDLRFQAGAGASAAEQQLGELGVLQDMIDAVYLERNIRECLPNVRFASDAGEGVPRPAYGGVVEGRVVDVSAPRGFRDDIERDTSSSTEVDPFSPDASWGLVELTVEVADDFDPSVEDPGTVVIGVVIPAPASEKRPLGALEGQRVLVVYEPPGRFELDPDLRFVARSGALLGLLADDGAISMPVLGDAEADFLGDLTTVDALAAAAAEPERTIDVTFDGAYERVAEHR